MLVLSTLSSSDIWYIYLSSSRSKTSQAIYSNLNFLVQSLRNLPFNLRRSLLFIPLETFFLFNLSETFCIQLLKNFFFFFKRKWIPFNPFLFNTGNFQFYQVSDQVTCSTRLLSDPFLFLPQESLSQAVSATFNQIHIYIQQVSSPAST